MATQLSSEYLTTVAFVFAIEYFLYGIHALLSCCTIYIHFYNKVKGHRKSRIYPFISFILLVLGTSSLVIDSVVTKLLFNGPAGWSHKVDVLESVNLIILSLCSITADTLFVYRLYVVWGNRTKVIIVPIILLIVAYCKS
ncbi:hypothetical protein K435DRAFT_334565 [Dendrothele bispora CBS 962.96]|uniref:Uncharacterized protein n=1 Tax=Dendrothele bispora (strain CBS 962.96) TaxID=1314807 RepID=A0A4S8MJ18_DENBC|nr:hypothetical protein K435DRAFT_334565 [Dendrothele bispora CBS 962.96]